MVRGVFLILIFLCATLVGCTSVPKEFRYSTSFEVAPTWPGLPLMPRYQYLGDIVGEDNFQNVNASGEPSIKRALHWIIGLNAKRADALRLVRPHSGMVDANERILVTDIGQQAVFVFDLVNQKMDVWRQAQLNRPFLAPAGITRGPDNAVFVSDAELGAVFRLSVTGNPIGQIRHDTLIRPTGIAYSEKDDRLYVADTRSHDIKVFNANGELLRTVGKQGVSPGEFNAPTYLEYFEGLLYITDMLNARVQIMDIANGNIEVIGKRGLYVGNLTRPKGVTTDSEGNIYIVESFYDHVLIFDPDRRYLLPIGGAGTEPGKFYLPAGIWTDRTSRLFVADMFNSRISVFQFLGR